MSHSPLLLLHIFSGTLGLLSGAVAITLRKGSRRHGIAGNFFVIAMFSLGATGAGLALLKSEFSNVLGGALTCYLVVTAWLTARRKVPEIRLFDWAALLVVSAVAAVTITFGLQAAMSPTGLKLGYSPGPYFFLGTVATAAAVGDLRMLLRRGVSGTQRFARHLWRMCLALFIASGSIFLARPHLYPVILQKTGVLVFLSILPLLLMIFWLIRVRFANAYKKKRPVPPSGAVSSVSA